jgi:hypothetical protein
MPQLIEVGMTDPSGLRISEVQILWFRIGYFLYG